MKNTFTNIPVLTTVAVTVTAISIWRDYGSESWLWFQRSGSIIVLIGAILSYRSILRVGLHGVGGTNATFLRGTVINTNTDGTINFKYDAESNKLLKEAFWDKVAGYIGAILLVYGTLIWGYGDLLGRTFR